MKNKRRIAVFRIALNTSKQICYTVGVLGLVKFACELHKQPQTVAWAPLLCLLLFHQGVT